MPPFRLRHTDRLVAGFLAAVVVVVLVSLFLVLRGHGLFQKRVTYRTVFQDGGGIAPQTPVRIAGMEVGTVTAVRLNADDKIDVEFAVFEEYADRMRQDPPGGDCVRASAGSMLDDEDKKKADETALKRCGSRVAASIPGGLGAFLPTSGLVIKVGNKANPIIEPGGLVLADEPEGLNEIFARLQKEGVVATARDIITQVDEILRRVNDEEGPIQHTLKHVELVTARAAAGKGLVGEITRDNSPTQQRVTEALNKLDAALADLAAASKNVNDVTATVKSKDAQLVAFIDAMEAFAVDAKSVGADLKIFAQDAKDVPPDVRKAVNNLDRRIDDLGAIVRGIKNRFPFADDGAPDRSDGAAAENSIPPGAPSGN